MKDESANLGGPAAGRCVELVRLAAGLPALAVDVLSVLPWAMAAQTTQRFQAGRVFLVRRRRPPHPAGRRLMA